MEVKEILSRQELGKVRRLARSERRRRREEAWSMTFRDVINRFNAHLSQLHSRVTLGDHGEETERGKLTLPDHCNVGRYEKKDEVALILHARDVGAPLLVRLNTLPSKVFEERLRHSAKIRGCGLHFFRLFDEYVGIEVYLIASRDLRERLKERGSTEKLHKPSDRWRLVCSGRHALKQIN